MENSFLIHRLKLMRDQVEQQFGAAIAGCSDPMGSELTLFIIPAWRAKPLHRIMAAWNQK